MPIAAKGFGVAVTKIFSPSETSCRVAAKSAISAASGSCALRSKGGTTIQTRFTPCVSGRVVLDGFHSSTSIRAARRDCTMSDKSPPAETLSVGDVACACTMVAAMRGAPSAHRMASANASSVASTLVRICQDGMAATPFVPLTIRVGGYCIAAATSESRSGGS